MGCPRAHTSQKLPACKQTARSEVTSAGNQPHPPNDRLLVPRRAACTSAPATKLPGAPHTRWDQAGGKSLCRTAAGIDGSGDAVKLVQLTSGCVVTRRKQLVCGKNPVFFPKIGCLLYRQQIIRVWPTRVFVNYFIPNGVCFASFLLRTAGTIAAGSSDLSGGYSYKLRKQRDSARQLPVAALPEESCQTGEAGGCIKAATWLGRRNVCRGPVFFAESLIAACYRLQDCSPVQCFECRGLLRVGAHFSVAPSAPALLDLGCTKCLQPGGHLNFRPRPNTVAKLLVASSETAVYSVNSSRTVRNNGATHQQHGATPFANQRLVTNTPARIPNGTDHFTACTNQSDTMPVPTVSLSQSENGGLGGGAVRLLASHRGEPGFRKWESCQTMSPVGGLSRGSPVPPPLHSSAAPFSSHFIFLGSQDHVNPEKTRRPAASSVTSPTCKNPELTGWGLNPVRFGRRQAAYPLSSVTAARTGWRVDDDIGVVHILATRQRRRAAGTASGSPLLLKSCAVHRLQGRHVVRPHTASSSVENRCWPDIRIAVDLCFTTFGVGPLVFVRGSMNTEAYCNILDNEILLTLWRFYGMDPCYFQDDNDMCHVSRATMQWYADNNVRRLDWPAQSTDHNPIEHLWDKLDRQVRACQVRPKSIAQLMERLQEEWRRIPVDVLETLVGSIPDRMVAVIAARDPSNYGGRRSPAPGVFISVTNDKSPCSLRFQPSYWVRVEYQTPTPSAPFEEVPCVVVRALDSLCMYFKWGKIGTWNGAGTGRPPCCDVTRPPYWIQVFACLSKLSVQVTCLQHLSPKYDMRWDSCYNESFHVAVHRSRKQISYYKSDSDDDVVVQGKTRTDMLEIHPAEEVDGVGKTGDISLEEEFDGEKLLEGNIHSTLTLGDRVQPRTEDKRGQKLKFDQSAEDRGQRTREDKRDMAHDVREDRGHSRTGEMAIVAGPLQYEMAIV
ncbi:hypothetical protein PR048_013738 [Dryococelus australis]|uniref:Transposase n=1 Tax=Dryococelus australis TaxID=614101 RepID=A0ABQ9HSZ5_9NEOP|nr:hypothetical protein PR048_013738 [Dryococelus australis]